MEVMEIKNEMLKLNYKFLLIISCIFFLALPRLVLAENVLTWEDCVKEILENNPDLNAAKEEVIQSRADKSISKASILPQISSQLSQRKSKTAGSKETNTYAYSVSGQQLIFDGFKTTSNINAAVKSLNAQEYDYMVPGR